MNPTKQRIALAEFCRWTWIESLNRGSFAWFDGLNNPGNRWQSSPEKNTDGIPDYLNDLNAVHEAEELLFDREYWTRYTDALIDKVIAKDESPIHATAAQRCEAILRAIGKWKEDTL